MNIQLFITLISIGTVVLNVGTALATLALCNRAWRTKMVTFARDYGLISIFFLSAASLAGSLTLQYAGALAPCILCWWQRICMYPIALISLIAVIKNTKVSEIADYVIALSIFGAAVSLYQHLLQMLPSGSLIPCDASGDCAVRSVFEFGYITVPWMALSVFAALFLIAILARKERGVSV